MEGNQDHRETSKTQKYRLKKEGREGDGKSEPALQGATAESGLAAHIFPEKCFAQRQTGGGRAQTDTQERPDTNLRIWPSSASSESLKCQTLVMAGAFQKPPVSPSLSWSLPKPRYVPETVLTLKYTFYGSHSQKCS